MKTKNFHEWMLYIKNIYYYKTDAIIVKKKILSILLLAFVVSCTLQDKPEELQPPENGIDGFNSLVKQTREENCVTFDSGLDINRNNQLDDNEVTASNQLCSFPGENGFNTLVEVESDEKCLTITTGLDENRNGLIDENETNNSDTICSTDGEDGDIGSPGSDGFNTLLRFDVLEVGGVCEFGGTRVNYGLDLNRDNELQDNEIVGFYDLCQIKCVKDPKCKYVVYDTRRCNSGILYSYWQDGKHFSNISLRFMVFADNTARLWGKVARHGNDDLYTLDVNFIGGSEDQYKYPQCIEDEVNVNDWIQYTEISGTLIADYTGEVFNLSRRGEATQFGIGSNPTNQYLSLGFSGWLYATNHQNCKADININLEQECW